MVRLHIVSFDAQGLRVPVERSKILYGFHKRKVDILLLQEIHFRADGVPYLHSKCYLHWIHSPNQETKSKGVSIA